MLVLQADTGINLATIKLSDKGFEHEEGMLMSGIIRAIQQFLHELKIGQIQNFETQEKQVIILKQGVILLALICDLNDDTDLYLPKIRYIANLFENKCDWDWDCWDGDLSALDDIVEKSEKMIKITNEEYLIYIYEKLLKEVININQVLGFRIYINGKMQKQFIKNLEDFELSAFLNSDIIETFINREGDIKNLLKNKIISDFIERSFVDYQKFAILRCNIDFSFSCIFFLKGKLDPIRDIEKINGKISIGGFHEF